MQAHAQHVDRRHQQGRIDPVEQQAEAGVRTDELPVPVHDERRVRLGVTEHEVDGVALGALTLPRAVLALAVAAVVCGLGRRCCRRAGTRAPGGPVF